MGPLVIDASAALSVALSDTPTTALDAYDLVAPALVLSERTSALVAAAYRGVLPPGALVAGLDRLEAMNIRIVASTRAQRRAALELARSVGWAKSYDAEYVVLARSLGCPLLTTDSRLARGAAQIVDVLDPRSLASA